MHITAALPPPRHCVDRHGQYFPLLRKALVYSSGNDPDPADICPTGRGVLTQLCHFISTVKSIKSTHTVRGFFRMLGYCHFRFSEDRLMVIIISGIFKMSVQTRTCS